MSMDWYYEQMETARPINDNDLAAIKKKDFDSGRMIEIGDMIFYGLLQEIDDNDKINLTLIRFHKDEINHIYKSLGTDDRFGVISPFPILKRIT